MISCAAEKDAVYISRVFAKMGLDEYKTRAGFVAHVVSISREALSKGLLFEDVVNVLVRFEKESGLPIGTVPPLELEWSEKNDDGELSALKTYIPRKEHAAKLLRAFHEKSKAKVIILLTKGFSERALASYAISKFLLHSGVTTFRVTSECPNQDVLDFYANVVLTESLPSLRPNSGWIVIRPLAREQGASPLDEEKGHGLIRQLYG